MEKTARLACWLVVCGLVGFTRARTYTPARLRANTSPPSLFRASEKNGLMYFTGDPQGESRETRQRRSTLPRGGGDYAATTTVDSAYMDSKPVADCTNDRRTPNF